MIELANAPKPKPTPTTTPSPVEGQPTAAAEREPAMVPSRATAQVQSKPLTSFGRRS